MTASVAGLNDIKGVRRKAYMRAYRRKMRQLRRHRYDIPESRA